MKKRLTAVLVVGIVLCCSCGMEKQNSPKTEAAAEISHEEITIELKQVIEEIS
ncbi:MAG: hypothetical protein K2M46_13955 [Lachnospiraceae bacterium]|nr:hypothetical protein [Lachnospiraceae bacterium]